MGRGVVSLTAGWLVLLGACKSQIVDPSAGLLDAGRAHGVMASPVDTGGNAIGNSVAAGAAPPVPARSSAAGISGSGGVPASASAPAADTAGMIAAGTEASGTGGELAAADPGSAGTDAADAPDAATGGADPADAGTADAGTADAGEPNGSPIKHVFVIAMENHDEGSIIGNTKDAKYINGELLQKYASGSKFVDRLAIDIVSEPHYVWMEAGTNSFSDHTFSSDDAPSASNSTASREHLATQLTTKGFTWMSYQEGIDGTSGACPIQSSGFYQPKHDPFIFFQDVSGKPPAKSNAACAAHHKEYGKLAADLMNHAVANYNFITPNQCHDMHGQDGCPSSNTIQAGDDWLRQNLPPLIAFADANDGVIFIVWDEGESSQQIPFLAIGARVKPHYVSAVEYDHSSLVKSIETIFELPVLSKVSAAHDFADLFKPGQFR